MPFSFKSIYYDTPIKTNRALDIFIPENITQKKSFFFVHGGGWRNGTRTVYHRIMEYLNNLGFICASVDYNLRAKNALEQIADLRDGYNIYLKELANLGINKPEIIVMGSSAGAHLGLLFTLTTPGQLGETASQEVINNFVSPAMGVFQATPTYFAPWEDIFPGIEVSMKDIAGVSYEENPQMYETLSPINFVGENSCPIFLLHASDEHMFPIWHALDFQKKMEKFNKVCQVKTYTPAEHGFVYDITRRVQKEAMADILEFIKEK